MRYVLGVLLRALGVALMVRVAFPLVGCGGSPSTDERARRAHALFDLRGFAGDLIPMLSAELVETTYIFWG